jgi:putative ATPase
MARSETRSLFGDSEPEPIGESKSDAPLAERMRPRDLDEFIGQGHLIGPGRLIRRLIEDGGSPPSLIFWGGPGTGKTTLARLLAGRAGARFVSLSGIKELREAIAEALPASTWDRRSLDMN